MTAHQRQSLTSQTLFCVILMFKGGRFIKTSPPFIIYGNALSTTEQIISQYQTSNDKQNRNDCCRDKKQDRHTCSEAEQHKSAYSSHIIPQFIQLYDILCGLSPTYDSSFSFSWAAAISSATFNASDETSFDPPVNLFTKSGTMSKIFVTASCCLIFTNFVTPF